MSSGILLIFAPLVAGYLVSIKNPSTIKTINRSTCQLIYLILGLMGLTLAALDNLADNLQTILQYTAVFFVCLGGCNLLVLPLIDKYLPLETTDKSTKVPLSAMMLESSKLIVVVGGGLLIGIGLPFDFSWADTAIEWVLYLLLFFIGIELRNSGLTLKQILLNKQGMMIALLVIVSSFVGGLIAAWFLDISPYHGLAMASGFGWYSLAGILMGDAFGPIYGGASFLVELLRELFALAFIPLFIRRFPCTSIGYAGATAMDFTLPLIQNTGGVKCVPVAIVSGFILSLLVPVLMTFFVGLAG